MKLIFVLLCYLCSVKCHIPWSELAEPDAPIFVSNTPQIKLTRQQSLQRLNALRSVMQSIGCDAYIIPTADAHNSQYIAPSDARREWISGLSGSSGTAIVTSDQALVWTDARYFTQFYMQVNTTLWSLMRQGTDASIQSWLSSNLSSGAVVGVDPTTYTHTAWISLENSLTQSNITLRATPDNLVDLARANIGDPAPHRPNNTIIVQPIQFSGRKSSDKINELVSQIRNRGASALVLTALDDIAYTLNLRGSDIPYNPVFFAYLVLTYDAVSGHNALLFWNNGELDQEIVTFLQGEGVTLDVKPYGEIFEFLRNLSNSLPTGSTIWLPDTASHAIFAAAAGDGHTRILSTLSPVVLIKCVKNDVELAGFRNAHIKDGTAVIRFLRWVHEEVARGENVTEIDVVNKLIEFRSAELDFMGPSFATIAGAGENGAVIHYKPDPDLPHRSIGKDEMLLVDSGGQYRDGTTDITRTRHMRGSPTPMQRMTFTRVMKGQISLATAVFPRGIVGHTLETLARKSLWDVGLNYGHGTGHGVGHFLNVHEGPSWILSGPSPTDPGIVAGMIFSNEPGYYEVDEYGIRHEDLVEVIEMDKNADHIMAEELVGDFGGVGALGFHTISLVPHQTACLNVSLLNEFEIKYINDYHARVLATIGPILKERGLNDDYNWLERECAPIRSYSVAIKATYVVILVSFIGKLL